ncbi:MAG: hypothetical protein D4R57_00130 [Verrucomicrobiales bacterium]|nr:MAG: hypothetical protein D4R57_00130 [Verrucomicrobiales bacterium]
MHLKLKHIVIVGLVVAGAETVWRHVSKKVVAAESSDKPLVAYAREADTTSFGAPVIVTNWQSQIGRVLISGGSASDQGNALLAMLPQTPAEGQVDVAQHAGRLLSDAAFASFGSQLTNASTPAVVRRVVFADLLTRPNSVKLPWLIEVAKSPVDNQSGEALLILKSILREDYGTDWNAWRERAVIWMMENP